MTRPEDALATCLRDLRTTSELTQKDVARALGVSVPLLSSWENGNATPPMPRLDAYARLFALDAPDPAPPPGTRPRPSLPAVAALTGSELVRYRTLLGEMIRMRGEIGAGGGGVGGGGGGGEPALVWAPPHPLRFPAGQAITIVCSELPVERRSAIGYADPQTPDFVESYKYADLDALIALLPHIGALSPGSEITVGTWATLSPDDLTAHLIALGGVDFNMLMRETLRMLTEVPVSQLGRTTDDDIGGFRIRDTPTGKARQVQPKFDNDRLVEDVAHFLRAPNPFNRERTITFFGGMYSRGSLGVVRALTEPKLKERNADYLARRFGDTPTYSIVTRVSILVDEVIVPDWTQPESRLHEWPPL